MTKGGRFATGGQCKGKVSCSVQISLGTKGTQLGVIPSSKLLKGMVQLPSENVDGSAGQVTVPSPKWRFK